MNKKIALIVASPRKNSLNKKMAHALMSLAPKTLQFKLVDIYQLPLYNQDLDDSGNPPEAWTQFRNEIKDCDGILFLTPEYNRSVPGALKNAIDVGSRPMTKSVWSGKPAAVMSVSPGSIGGFGANHHLRQSLVTLNAPTMPAPEAYIGKASEIFDEKGELANKDVLNIIQKFINAFYDWVNIPFK
jgi:chromate reductase